MDIDHSIHKVADFKNLKVLLIRLEHLPLHPPETRPHNLGSSKRPYLPLHLLLLINGAQKSPLAPREQQSYNRHKQQQAFQHPGEAAYG